MTPEQFAEYLATLLIIQYHNKPKAIATVIACCKYFPIDLIKEVENGFDVNTAVGKQLDILGKYIGVDRFYIDDNNNIVPLSDEDYRLLLKFKIITNHSNSSHYDIDTSIYNFFGSDVVPSSQGDMAMTYFIMPDYLSVVKAAIQKNALPRPMGVGVNYVILQASPFFGFVRNNNLTPNNQTGYRTNDNLDKEGEYLTNFKLIEVRTTPIS